jgi:hypothetical protein
MEGDDLVGSRVFLHSATETAFLTPLSGMPPGGE